MSYRPLPTNVTIKNSPVEGLGLFAVVDIPVGYELGVSHVADDRFENNYVRTPLGGFYNHSEDPNCEAYKDDIAGVVRLKTIKTILAGEELTGKYWLYSL